MHYIYLKPSIAHGGGISFSQLDTNHLEISVMHIYCNSKVETLQEIWTQNTYLFWIILTDIVSILHL